MVKLIPFNINDNIYVRLKPKAEEVLRRHWQRTADVMQKDVDEIVDSQYPGWREGTIKIQLWCFMELFGEATHIGVSDHFATQLKLEVKEPDPEPIPAALRIDCCNCKYSYCECGEDIVCGHPESYKVTSFGLSVNACRKADGPCGPDAKLFEVRNA